MTAPDKSEPPTGTGLSQTGGTDSGSDSSSAASVAFYTALVLAFEGFLDEMKLFCWAGWSSSYLPRLLASGVRLARPSIQCSLGRLGKFMQD